MVSKSTGILYLSKNGFGIYNNRLLNILEFPFKSGYIDYLNITDKQILENDIQKFISANKIPIGNLIIVIADDASLIKDIKEKENINKYLENMLLSDSAHSFITNQELLNTIRDIFKNQGFEIDYIMPGIVYSGSISTASELTLEKASVIFRETLSLAKYNLIPQQFTTITPDIGKSQEALDKQRTKKDILRLYALVSVFGMLIVAVLTIWYINPFPAKYRSKAVTEPSITATPSLPIPTMYSAPASESAAPALRDGI